MTNETLNTAAIDAALQVCGGISAEAIDAVGKLTTDEREVLKLILARIDSKPKKAGRPRGSKNKAKEAAA